jgi:hypothetical protein
VLLRACRVSRCRLSLRSSFVTSPFTINAQRCNSRKVRRYSENRFHLARTLTKSHTRSGLSEVFLGTRPNTRD